MNAKLFLFFVLLCIAPAWIFEFVPLVDYPRHLFIAHVAKNPASFAGFFELNPLGVPNSMCYPILIALNFFMPLAIAGKVLLSITIALFVFGVKYLSDSLGNGKSWSPLFGVILLFTLSFVIGFVNFLIGTGISFFALGYWARNAGCGSARKKIILSVLLLMVYFAHLMAFSSLFFITAAAAFFYFQNAKKAFFSLLPFAPALAAFALFFLAAGGAVSDFSPVIWQVVGQKLRNFLFLLSPVSNGFGNVSLLLALFAASTAAICLFFETMYSAAFKRFGEKSFTKLRKTNCFAKWLMRWNTCVKNHLISHRIHSVVFNKSLKKPAFRKNMRAALAAALAPGVLLFLLLPNSAGTYWPIDSRLAFFLVAYGAILLRQPKKQFCRRIFDLLLTLGALAAIAGVFMFFSQSQQEIGEYVSGISLVEENSRLLPLIEWDNGFLPVNLHSDSYYLIEKGGVSPYFTLTKMFPIAYAGNSYTIAPVQLSPQTYDNNAHAKHFDYVIAYGSREKYEKEIEKSFEKIFENRGLALYKKKSPA